MASPNEKLASSLDLLSKVQRNGIVRLPDLSRTHRERLLNSGFLQEVTSRWFIVSNPAVPDGASTSYYASFWSFLSQYLANRFGADYCLAPEPSIKRHVGADLIPRQVIVIVRENINQNLPLCFDTSLYFYHTKHSFPEDRVNQDGLWIMDLPAALCRVPETFFKTSPADAEIALRMIRDPSKLLRILLPGGNTVIAARLIGAYTYLGEAQIAQQIKETMNAAGNSIRSVTNPFERQEPYLTARTRIVSAHAARIQSLWAAMRPSVQAEFPAVEDTQIDPARYLAEVEERYAEDAYNSLSIEGYRVSAELIERVRRGDWSPSSSNADNTEANALAARGYYQAFQAVKSTIGKILNGAEPVGTVKQEYPDWYREMFIPAVNAGILKVDQLAGYRDSPVYLRGSRYVPPSSESVPDCMDALFDLMDRETDAAVRAVLGHFIFVYIHPYSDGNGRIGRFLMNTMFASGGFPWTVIRQNRRDQYMAVLEEASVNHDLRPFSSFVREEMLAPSFNSSVVQLKGSNFNPLK